MLDERDPVKISYSFPFDRRFADLVVTSENAPSSADGSIGLAGLVAFGSRRQKGKSARTYIIDIKTSFLSIDTEACRFHPNMRAQRIIQDGSFNVEISSENTLDTKSNISGSLSLSASTIGHNGKANGTLKVDKRNNSALKEKKTTKHELFISRWIAGGCVFGSIERGNQLDSQGFLQG